MPPLRLAVDARVVADRRGIGRYVRAILQRFAARGDVDLTLLTFGPFTFRHRGAFARALGSGRFGIRSQVPRDADVVWHPANGTFFSSKAPSVASIHDLGSFHFPDTDLKKRASAQAPIRRSARDAARVVTGSHFSKGELHEFFGIPLERIDVIHHGVEPAFSPGAATPLPEGLIAQRYVLFVGPIAERRKNFDVVLQAHRLAYPDAEIKLVVVGPEAPPLPGIVHVENVAEGGMRALYRGAVALLFPSRYEGFGLPAIEAMACGTPVLASSSPPLPEIGADAALYFDADDPVAWSRAMRDVAGDAALRDRLRVAGLDRATHFDWNESARQHLELFRNVAAS